VSFVGARVTKNVVKRLKRPISQNQRFNTPSGLLLVRRAAVPDEGDGCVLVVWLLPEIHHRRDDLAGNHIDPFDGRQVVVQVLVT
jgi:hypothetical protein